MTSLYAGHITSLTLTKTSVDKFSFSKKIRSNTIRSSWTTTPTNKQTNKQTILGLFDRSILSILNQTERWNHLDHKRNATMRREEEEDPTLHRLKVTVVGQARP